MPRRLTLIPRELGVLELYFIYSRGGVWEAQWKPLQGHPFARSFTQVPKEVVDHALVGWTKPLVQALGIPPEGALRKIPPETRQCHLKKACSLYIQRDCVPTADSMPWCYEPGGIADEVTRKLAAEAIGFWREGVYIVVVLEDG